MNEPNVHVNREGSINGDKRSEIEAAVLMRCASKPTVIYPKYAAATIGSPCLLAAFVIIRSA